MSSERGQLKNWAMYAFASSVSVPTLLWPAISLADVQIAKDKIVYYEIFGTTGQELRASLTKNSPVGKHDADNIWDVSWTFSWQPYRRNCRITRHSVKFRSTTRFPRVKDETVLPQPLLIEWTRYKTVLMEHEMNHRGFGFRAAEEIDDALRGLSLRGGYTNMEKRVNNIAHKIFKRRSDQNNQYDRDTKFGATEGAEFY